MGDSIEAAEKGLKARTMWNPRKGGYGAAMFIFVMTGLENIGFVSNMVMLVLYFLHRLHFDLAGSSTTLTNLMGTTFLLTVLGGFISDTYMTRHNTVLMFGLIEIVGYILLTIQAHFKDLHPVPDCLTCKLEGRSKGLFYLSFCLLALGYGGVRGALPALGADQFDRNDPKERKQLGSFFNWLLLSITLGATFGVTVIVWVATQKSTWDVGFLSQMLIALLGFMFLALGKPFYRNRVAGDSPLVRVLQVFVVAIKNRNASLPSGSEDLYEINEKGAVEEKIPHTDQFRFLDKAAVLLPKGADPEPWKVCTVTQVEEVKVLTRMLPILASTVIMNTCLAQLQTFSVQQGYIMDLNLGSFPVPAASIPVIPLVFMSILVPIYEFFFVPLARRITGHPTGITHLQRVAVGLILSAVSMAVAAVIEVKRRNAFNYHLKQMSVFWLSFQYGIFGIADMFTFVGLMEFFYSEAPAGMLSLATSFSFLTISLGYFLSSVFVKMVEAITGRMASNGQGWLYGLDLNMNHLDKFYWLLAVMSCVNFVVYVLCAKWYKYRGAQHGGVVVNKQVNERMQDLVKENDQEAVSEGDHQVKNQEENERMQDLVKENDQEAVSEGDHQVKNQEENERMQDLAKENEEVLSEGEVKDQEVKEESEVMKSLEQEADEKA